MSVKRSGNVRVLVIDNYDSFTYNLVQYLGELGAEVEVVRNDVETVDELLAREPDRVVVSPGPCTPAEAGVSIEAISSVRRGGNAGARRLPRAPVPGRGVRRQGDRRRARSTARTRRSSHDGRTIYEGVRSPMVAGRYHSLIADAELPAELEVSSTYGDVVMGVRHRELPAEGVQFHPESVLTPQGKHLLDNFLRG